MIPSQEEFWSSFKYCGFWVVLSCLIALAVGTVGAMFLLALDWATTTREAHPLLMLGLPVAGFFIAYLYLRFGKAVEAGNNLLIDEIHDPKKIVPIRMAPLILFSTVVSHLFGASVGREGTAVQMGGALADQLSQPFRLDASQRRVVLMAGISAGFSAVFGTPLAGAIFALEVLAIGRLRHDALWPCLLSAILANQVCLAWGVHHTAYMLGSIPAVAAWPLLAAGFAGALFGLMGRFFAVLTHTLTVWVKSILPYAPFRPIVGGVLLVVCVFAFGLDRYTGLGIPSIQAAFLQPVPAYDFLGKLLLTVLSLGSGFKGGEVTPLFYIGATMGNALAPVLQMPIGLMAALGFVAVFAGAANTPIACSLMAIELFGVDVAPYAALACVVSYLFSGHSGIYRAQKVESKKPF